MVCTDWYGFGFDSGDEDAVQERADCFDVSCCGDLDSIRDSRIGKEYHFVE